MSVPITCSIGCLKRLVVTLKIFCSRVDGPLLHVRDSNKIRGQGGVGVAKRQVNRSLWLMSLVSVLATPTLQY